MDVFSYNKQAWDHEVATGNRWTVPVSPEQVAAARNGKWSLLLTPTKPVPQAWFPELRGKAVLCLASGGGQQGPILSAVGAQVTVLDASERQLARDEEVAARDGLSLRTVLGDMRDLSMFSAESFDLIFHPVSNCFTDDVRVVWREAFRVLRRGGSLLSGISNPFFYTFDLDLKDKGILQLKYKIPYSDLNSLTDQERARYTDKNSPLEYGHTLEDQIGGQTDVGFIIAGFYEDWFGDPLIDQFIPSFIATRALKL